MGSCLRKGSDLGRDFEQDLFQPLSGYERGDKLTITSSSETNSLSASIVNRLSRNNLNVLSGKSLEVIDEGVTENKRDFDGEMFNILEPFIPRYSKLRHVIRRIKLDRSKIEHIRMENGYMFYDKLKDNHVVVFNTLMWLLSRKSSVSSAIIIINHILLTLTYDVQIRLSEDTGFSLYFDLSPKLNLSEKISMIENIINIEENDQQIIEQFVKRDEEFSWFISHNGSIKDDCINLFGFRDCFIDKLCFESESNNTRWLIMNMCKSRGVILMVNRKYVESKWCMWEFNLAKMIRNRKDFKIFPILLDGDFGDYPPFKEFPGKSTKNMPLPEIVERLFSKDKVKDSEDDTKKKDTDVTIKSDNTTVINFKPRDFVPIGVKNGSKITIDGS